MYGGLRSGVSMGNRKNSLGKEVIENVFTAKKIDQQVIKGDGSTIVNVCTHGSNIHYLLEEEANRKALF